MDLELEHSAPANDEPSEVPIEGVNWWQCGKPGSTPTQTVLPIVVVAKLVEDGALPGSSGRAATQQLTT